MKFKFPISVLVATLAFSGNLAFQAEAQTSQNTSSTPVTVFRCVPQGKAFATIAQRGTRISRPMIIWESYVFGPEYTPQQRCQNVSQRLTMAVAQNGGKLRNLLLTTGRVDGYTVVCYVNSGAPRCNRSNTLFTLKPENAQDPGAALAGLLVFGKTGSGSPLRESAGGEDDDGVVDLEATVEKAFAAGSHESAGEAPNSPKVQPSSTPSPQPNGAQSTPQTYDTHRGF